MSFVKSKLTSRLLADVTLVVTVIDNPKLLNILMISFFFLSLLCRNKFLNIPKPSSLYNPTLFCSCIMGLVLMTINVQPHKFHHHHDIPLKRQNLLLDSFFNQGSSWWNNNVFLAFNRSKCKVKRLSEVCLYNLQRS